MGASGSAAMLDGPQVSLGALATLEGPQVSQAALAMLERSQMSQAETLPSWQYGRLFRSGTPYI